MVTVAAVVAALMFTLFMRTKKTVGDSKSEVQAVEV